jgi:hypothetical protein
MGKLVGADERLPRKRVNVTLSEEGLGMIEEIAMARGGAYISQIIEECVREFHKRWQKGRGLRKIKQRRPSPTNRLTKAQREALDKANKPRRRRS